MSHPSIRFSEAIVRRPAPSATRGLRAKDRGAPDIARMMDDHAAYVRALEGAGARVHVLNALDAFPDGMFVEDVALCLPEGAVLLKPCAPSRAGEVREMQPELAAHFDDIRAIRGRGTIEGGDILVTPREILVGLSARTSREGAAELARIVAGWGYRVRLCETPPEVLHFKTACALIDAQTILATPRLAATGCFDGYRVLFTAPGEEGAANAIRFNDLVILSAAFGKTAGMLREAGHAVVGIRGTEFDLLDGGMSCLSLRFGATGR